MHCLFLASYTFCCPESLSHSGANKAKNRTTDPTTDVAAPGTAAAAAPEQPEPVKVPFVSYDDRIKELEHFRKGNGHCRVPNKYPGLGRWVMELRILYKKMQEDPKSQHKHFKQQHVEKLEAMGFEWRLKAPDKTWLERYRDIIKYKETHGTPNVPRVYKGESMCLDDCLSCRQCRLVSSCVQNFSNVLVSMSHCSVLFIAWISFYLSLRCPGNLGEFLHMQSKKLAMTSVRRSCF